MKIGIDLDNTLIDYSRIFDRLLSEHADDSVKIEQNLSAYEKKNLLKKILKQDFSEDYWVKIQGQIYNHWLTEAQLYQDAMTFIDVFALPTRL